MRTAIIVVDMQNDFMDDGTLPVKGARAIIPAINHAIASLLPHNPLVITTQDWHPLDHSQLQPNGGPWPVHCIQDTHGAELVDGLYVPFTTLHVFKGFEKDKDGYSGFEGKVLNTPLLDVLQDNAIDHVYVCGVATEYCVQATALDARKNGFATSLLTNCIAGVEAKPGDIALAMAAMQIAGVLSISFS